MKRFVYSCAAVFFLCILQLRIPAQTVPVKSEQALLSDSVYTFFVQEGFEAERQMLLHTMSKDFPYNVLISIHNNSDTAQDKKKLIISCAQRDASVFLPEFAALIRRIYNLKTDVDIDFVFTANDYSPAGDYHDILQAPEYRNAGTLTYINSTETDGSTAAFILQAVPVNKAFSRRLKAHAYIIPGARGENRRGSIVPRDFFSLFARACTAAQLRYSIEGIFLSLYRLGFIPDEPLVSDWFSADIPAVLIKINDDNRTGVFTMLEHSIQEYSAVSGFGNDRHYSVFTLFNRSLIIAEYVYLIFLSAAAVFALFVFFIFSFIRGAHRYIHRAEFFKTWYLIPITVLVTAAFLQLSQHIMLWAAGDIIHSPLFFLTVKTVFSLVFFVFVFFPLAYYILKLPLTGFIYGYLLSIAAFLNIFLFACTDISLIPIFIAEYTLIAVSRTARRAVPLICCALIGFFPYAPFIHSTINFDEQMSAYFIGKASFGMDLLFAALLLPFAIMMIRILLRLKSWKRRGTHGKKTMSIQAAAAVSFSAVFFTVLFALSRFIRPPEKKNLQETLPPSSNSTLTLERTAQFGRSLFTVKLSSKQPVVRYYVEVQADSVLPVFDANYPYDIFLKPHTAVFALDDYPPEPLILMFSAEGVQNTLCTVTAFTETDSGIKTEQLSYSITGVHK